MTLFNEAPVVSVKPSLTPALGDLQIEQKLKAAKLLADYEAGIESAIALFKDLHPAAKRDGFVPGILDARQVVGFQSMNGLRLSLEKLKKEAKRLLKNVKAADAIALHRIRSNHPKVRSGDRDVDQLSLVDIQHVLARENGFDSWPKLKAHLYAMEAAKRLVVSGKTIDPPKSAHLRCGSDIGQPLKEAGFKGDFVEIVNPFTMGPVHRHYKDEASLTARINYIDSVLLPFIPKDDKRDTRSMILGEEEALNTLGDKFDAVTLWFEHDAYDQLCLAYILNRLSEQAPNLTFTLDLVQVSSFPGYKRFIGLGQLGGQAENLALLFQQRVTITPQMMSFGATLWEAFTSQDPTELWNLSQEKDCPLPIMQNAIHRMMQELPSPIDGLGLTERLGLQIIAGEDSLLLRRAFLFLLAERDPQPYHGDIMFFAMMKELWEAENPALEIVGRLDAPGPGEGKEILKVTEFGHALLRGEANWIKSNKIDRWVGGVEVNSRHKKNWYFQDRKNGPILR